jgi:quinol monooxygenase YgiN
VPTLPWLSVSTPDSGTTAVVMASRFRVRSLGHVPRFLIDSLRIHRQVRAADGALGISLIARPLHREFLTLSAWRDRTALDALVRAQPHVGAMRRHRPAMAEATFTFWDVPAGGLPVTWEDARRRLDAERAGSSGSAVPGRGARTRP